MNGGNLPASAVQVSITLNWFFSLPCVLMVTVFDRFNATVEQMEDQKSGASGPHSQSGQAGNHRSYAAL